MSVLLDPWVEVSDVSVDTGVSEVGAAMSPGDNTNETAAGDQWATGITLASILVWSVGADHGVLDLAAIAVFLGGTIVLLDDLQIDSQQMIGNLVATRCGSAPARDDSFSAILGIGHSHANSTDGRTEAQRRFDANDGNIVDHGPGIVALVVLESSDGVQAAAGAPVGATDTYLDLGSGYLLQTVSGSDHNIVGVDGSTAEVGSAALQRHLVGMIIDARLVATNNATIQLRQQTLGYGCREGAGGQGKKNQESEHLFSL